MAKHRKRKHAGGGAVGARLSCRVVAVKRRIMLKCPGAKPILLKRGKGGLVPMMKAGKKGGRRSIFKGSHMPGSVASMMLKPS